MLARDNKLGLPMISNLKTVDPRDENSTPVYQLETAMGSAIGVFDGAQAVRVSRTRFAPVKKTDDLLAVRSDIYQLTDDYHIIPLSRRELDSINIELDHHFKFVSDFEERFPHGVPSLINCERLSIAGDFRFEEDVTCQGSVTLVNNTDGQITIPSGTVLSGYSKFNEA
jgi:UTP--glucose-1-phosphate uridylyltransferase